MQAVQEGPSNVQDEMKFLELLLSLNLADLGKWFHTQTRKEHQDSNKQTTKFIFALWQSLGFLLLTHFPVFVFNFSPSNATP